MADAESIDLIVKAGDLFEPDTAKSPSDGRITALLAESFFKTGLSALHGAEYGREGQETLINIIIEKLFFHARVYGKVDQLVVGIEQQTVFRKPALIHRVGEGTAAASIIIEGFRKKTGRGGFQQTAVNGQAVFPKFKRKRHLKKVLLKQAAAEDFIAEAGGDTIVEEMPGKKHNGKNLRFKPLTVIEAWGADIPPLDVFFGGDSGVIAANDICVIFRGGCAHALIHDGINPVVAVHESGIDSRSLPKPFLSGRHVAAVFFVEAADAGIPCGVGVAEGGRAVRGAVVHEEDFKVRECLGENAVEACGEVVFYIIYRDNDA